MHMASLPWRDAYIGFQTLALKEINRVLRIWVQTIVPPAIQMTLYFIIFGSLIGKRVGEMGGYSYMEYLAPGLIMMSVVMNSYTNSVSSFFGAKFGRHIEELLVSPLPNVLILLGYVAGSVCRGLLVGILVAAIATAFTHLPLTHPFVMVSVVILTSTVFALGGVINAIFAQKFDDVTIIPTFVLTPLIYLGGVFYSIDLLSPTWRMASKIDPILYMVNAFRYGFLGVSDISIGIAYGIICTFIVVLFSVALYLLNKGIGLRS
ncbi:MAG TPA: ABC transporter permease [Gammaproteobacteria bacterium]|nr:ABC transporter permease [Gammaproteobacteria bacterium]